MVASVKINRARLEVLAARGAGLGIFVQRLKCWFAGFSLVMIALLPAGAVAQIRESLLPYPRPPTAPQAEPSATAPIGVRWADFFWYPRAEIDGAYNSNIFATPTGFTYDLLTALTSSFDVQSNFSSQNSLNLHAGS